MTSEEIKQAMRNETPVMYNGVKYEKISAYIYRAIKDKHTGLIKFILQVELVDVCGISVIIADARKVEFLQ